jgi:tetratricopeptide (TPR) repeat protein
MFFLYLMQGDLDRAAELVASNEAVQIDAASYLAAARDEQDERLGSAISRYERLARDPVFGTSNTLLRLADLYARAGEPRKAIRALRNFHSHLFGAGVLGTWVGDIVHSHVLLGRAYEAAGEPHSAEREYRWVLRMWNDADPDLKELADVRARLAALEGTAAR